MNKEKEIIFIEEDNLHNQQTKPEAIRNNVLVEGSRNLVDEELSDKNADANLSFKCSRCNKSRKHYALGQCKSCYNYLHLDKEKHKLDIAKWKEKNPKYFKEYYRNNLKKKISEEKIEEIK